MNTKKPKIAFCGAHGTGKTTLAKALANEYGLEVFGSLRNRWQNFGVEDFDKLPIEVRTAFQHNKMLISHIEKEDELWGKGFIFDSSVLDCLAYTIVSSDMSDEIKSIHSILIKERIKKYDLLIYTPIEFKAEDETLRVNIESQKDIDAIIKNKLEQWLTPNQYLIVTGTVEQRINKIKQALSKKGF